MFRLFVEVEINKLRTEEAGLRDALLKMQALNEGLGQDKIELNRIIMHLEQEKATLQVCSIFYMLTYLRQHCQSFTKVLNYRTSYKQWSRAHNIKWSINYVLFIIDWFFSLFYYFLVPPQFNWVLILNPWCGIDCSCLLFALLFLDTGRQTSPGEWEAGYTWRASPSRTRKDGARDWEGRCEHNSRYCRE